MAPAGSLSPHHHQHHAPPPGAASMPVSPSNTTTSNASAAGAMRPPLMRKQSSQTSHSSRQNSSANITSPGSATDHHPLRHPVRTARHAKIVLPRNHSSARNLTKLNGRQQVQYADDGRKHARQRSHEGDTEIRLPGSLDESVQSKPPMRRNMTAYQLPRNTSHAKLKKNLSHGQLTRLGGSSKNLQALGQQRAPPSPGLKGKSKRPKSAEITAIEDLAERPVQQRKNSTKKVGFAVGSAGDTSEGEEALQMEGSGLQEDEWTEDSASASPYSTRQNTANNSRRTSVVVNPSAEKLATRAKEVLATEEIKTQNLPPAVEDDDEDDEEDESDAPSPLTMGQQQSKAAENIAQPRSKDRETKAQSKEPQRQPEGTLQAPSEQSTQVHSQHQSAMPKPPQQRSPLHLAKEYPNPTTSRLLDKHQQLPAPALVSNVSALDDTHSSRGSPAPSLRSSRSNIAEPASSDPQEDELISRFVPSGSHPSTGSGPTTALSTPKQTEFHTPEENPTTSTRFQIGPVSPGSTVSSGTTTPAIGRSRTELRMLQEKAMADLESQADQRPFLPAHVYDRRNESLKSWVPVMGGAGGADVFQGRFRALNTELRVVRKYRDPIGEAVQRLRACRGSRVGQRRTQNALATSRSAVSLPVRRQMAGADLARSASPPKREEGAGSARVRREVSFAAETREVSFEGLQEADEIARELWEAI